MSMTTLLRALSLSFCALLLGSCVSPKPLTTAPPPSGIAAGYPTDLQGARLYKLAPEQSKLHILVYRGGTMANLGHNHVVSSGTLSGYVWLHDLPMRSGFNITLPVNDLIVDDAQARAAEGMDFVSTVSDSARAGTRVNMLKAEQLDGEHYPSIRLRSVSIAGTRAQPEVHAQITIKDQTRELTLPVQLSTSGQALRATGQFQIKLTDFGITPYSVALGALQVQDQLTVKFELVAMQ